MFDGVVTNNEGLIIGLKKNGKMLYNFKYFDYVKKMKSSCDGCDNSIHNYCNENDIDLFDVGNEWTKEEGCGCCESR